MLLTLARFICEFHSRLLARSNSTPCSWHQCIVGIGKRLVALLNNFHKWQKITSNKNQTILNASLHLRLVFSPIFHGQDSWLVVLPGCLFHCCHQVKKNTEKTRTTKKNKPNRLQGMKHTDFSRHGIHHWVLLSVSQAFVQQYKPHPLYLLLDLWGNYWSAVNRCLG